MTREHGSDTDHPCIKRYLLFRAPVLLFHSSQCVKAGLSVVSGFTPPAGGRVVAGLAAQMVIAALRRSWRVPSGGRCVRTSGRACVQRRSGGIIRDVRSNRRSWRARFHTLPRQASQHPGVPEASESWLGQKGPSRLTIFAASWMPHSRSWLARCRCLHPPRPAKTKSKQIKNQITISVAAMTITVSSQLIIDTLLRKITPTDPIRMIPSIRNIQARRNHRAFKRFR